MEKCYRAKSNRNSCQTNQATVASIGLVNGVGIVVAQLIDDLMYLVVIVCSETFTYELLESVASAI